MNRRVFILDVSIGIIFCELIYFFFRKFIFRVIIGDRRIRGWNYCSVIVILKIFVVKLSCVIVMMDF